MVFLMSEFMKQGEEEFLYIDTFDGDMIDSKAQIIGNYFQHSNKIQLAVKSHFILEPVKTILTILGVDTSEHFSSIFPMSFINEKKQVQQLNVSVTNVTSMKYNKRTGTGFIRCLLSVK